MQVLNFIVNWIKSYSKKYKLKTLVIGVSGGIDSALTSSLCAMTGIRTIIVSIPIHQKNKEIDAVTKHKNWLINNFKNIIRNPIDKKSDGQTALENF